MQHHLIDVLFKDGVYEPRKTVQTFKTSVAPAVAQVAHLTGGRKSVAVATPTLKFSSASFATRRSWVRSPFLLIFGSQ
jgi:hypothetical protein